MMQGTEKYISNVFFGNSLKKLNYLPEVRDVEKCSLLDKAFLILFPLSF